MACNICSQPFHDKRTPICSSCARATLYEPRMQQLSVLLNKDTAQAEAILRPGNDGVLASLPQDADWDAIATGIKKEAVSRLQDEIAVATDRIEKLAGRVRSLSGEMLVLQDEITTRHAQVKHRREVLQREVDGLTEHRLSIQPLDATFRKSNSKLGRVHQRSANAKASLCCTAASIAGLKQEADRGKHTGRILLGNLPVLDLRELGAPKIASSTPVFSGTDEQHRQMINAQMDNISRLVSIWSLYLSVSTPAEIILPHNDFPHSAILSLKSSYKTRERPEPTAQIPRTGSPAESRVLSQTHGTARPRLLYLDRPLSKLAKEDAKAFGLYVEGVTLLAWNVAWLCRVQGITAINSFDEVCDIGRNLWLFLRTAEMQVSEAAAGRKTPNANGSIKGASFGVMSHGTLLHSLAGHEGTQHMQTWRLLQPHRLIDKLRLLLVNELTGAEWDVLSEQDYDEEREDEAPVLVGGNTRRQRGINPALSVMSIQAETNNKQDKGWMRVRGRPGDAAT